MTYVRTKRFAAVGYYQYLAKSRDAASQARDFTATIGRLAPNEFPILDLEEGSGSQVARAEAWFSVVDQWAAFPASLYSGKSMMEGQLGGVAHWRDRPLWLAAYLNSYSADMSQYPHRAHDWWQYSDRARFPGLAGPVDASVFPDDLEHFLPTVRPKRGSAPTPRQGDQSIETVTMPSGGQETFVEAADGTVWHSWQKNAIWQPWSSLGKP